MRVPASVAACSVAVSAFCNRASFSRTRPKKPPERRLRARLPGKIARPTILCKNSLLFLVLLTKVNQLECKLSKVEAKLGIG